MAVCCPLACGSFLGNATESMIDAARTLPIPMSVIVIGKCPPYRAFNQAIFNPTKIRNNCQSVPLKVEAADGSRQ